MRVVLWWVLVATALGCRGAEWRLDAPTFCYGMCDASGGVPAGRDRFVVANDEDNILRVYDCRRGGPPLQQFDLNDFLAVDEKKPETDLEAATLVGNRAFWMGSHGRNKAGKRRASRCRFFATDIRVDAGLVTLVPVGKPYTALLDDFVREPSLAPFHLAEASLRAPKEEGALNIEGLAATPENTLLVGFRNPIPGGKALLVPLLNPNDMLEGKTARLGPPILLNLHGLGIRDMVRSPDGYLIIAGHYDSGGHSRLYRWRGPGHEPERFAAEPFRGFNPEAILLYSGSENRELQLLSDDGTREIGGSECKLLQDPLQRVFRSYWLRE